MNSARGRFSGVVVCAFVFFLTSLVVGCSRDKGVNPNDGSISGRVFKAGSTYPVSGATVKCAEQSVRTDYNGVYELKDLPRGSHLLTATKENYEYFSVSVNIAGNTTHDIYIKIAKSDGDGDDEQ